MDKTQKKTIRRYIGLGCGVVLVLLLAVLPLLATPEAAEDGPQASILSVQAEPRDITRMLIGGGTLASPETVELTIPAQVKLTEFLVGNGDVVAEGDAIARVDPISVMGAIVQVQETLEYLARKLDAAKDDVVSETVSANVSGTVKHVYAEKGADVADVMLEHGALAVISLDDRMAVKLSGQTELAAGDTVTVTLSDASQVTGTVASNLNGELVVTVEDKNYAEGDVVSVATRDGTFLGEGTLSIYSPWKAHGYSGIVGEVNVKEGQKVNAGQTLLRLTDTGATAEYQELMAQRLEYEEMIHDLFRMYESGTLTAPCDGIVSGVDPDGDFLLQEHGSGFQRILAGVITASGSNDRAEPPAQTENGGGTNGLPGGQQQIVLPGVNQAPTPPSAEQEQNPAEPAPKCTKEENCGGLLHEPGCPLSGVTVTTYSGWVAIVESVDENGVVLKKAENAITTASVTGLVFDAASLTQPYTAAVTTYSDGSRISAGDKAFLLLDGSLMKISGGQTPGDGGQISGGMGGMAGFGGIGGIGGGVQAAPFEPYPLDTVLVANITSQETMTLDITVDEGDVLSLRVGQEAELTVSPLGGQHFGAVITRISNDGTNAGGRSKFQVTASTDKHRDMYPGMTGTLYITAQTARQVTAIPVAALVEEGPRSVVYTGYDEETETLMNPVEVTTGISDGEYVEVIGLEPGTKVWYAYYDTVPLSLTPEMGGFF